MTANVHGVPRFATASELYDRVRPSYLRDSVWFIRNAVDAPLNIVEIGAGTGLFTRALLADDNDDHKIVSLKAVEPSAGTREMFKQRVCHDRVSISDGTFESVPFVENGSVDLIVIAMPTGAVAFIWILEDRYRDFFMSKVNACLLSFPPRDAAGWLAQVRDRIQIYEGSAPQFRQGLWRQAFSTDVYTEYFGPPEEKEWAYRLEASDEICVERALNKRYMSILPPDLKESVAEDIKAILAKGVGKVWIDESNRVFEFPYRSFVVLSRRK